jgi:hypothetical protein
MTPVNVLRIREAIEMERVINQPESRSER